MAYLAAILLLPLLSWTVTTGGFPLCCWGTRAMDAACPMHRLASCPMQTHTGSMPAHCVSTHTQLTLPTPLIPVVPLPPAPVLALLPLQATAVPPAQAQPHAGWPAAVFHPPSA